MCWCPKTSEHACGWPPKTVRALLALITVTMVLGAELVLVVYLADAEKYSEAIAVIGMMAAELTSVIGWYFGSSKAVADVENPAMASTADEAPQDGVRRKRK